jgi:ubiquinone/menaquinone biosynthesis C-methylase UbiE
MAKNKKSPVENYHDRVAGIYDTIYDNNPYWEAVFEITWRHVLKFLPKDLSTRCLDVGCGTGRWGMKLFKTGYPTDFLDISWKMLDQVGKKIDKLAPDKRPELIHTGIDDLSMIQNETYDFIIGQGDPLNCADRPEKALKELCRVLRPGGIILMSVDNRHAGIFHYFRAGDVAGLAAFIKNGKTKWVTDDPSEQYDITMFTADNIRALCEQRGLKLLSLIGKTVLPLRRFQEMLVDRNQRLELLKLEESLNKVEAMLGNAAHLEFVAQKPAKD